MIMINKKDFSLWLIIKHFFVLLLAVPTHSGSEIRSFRNVSAIAALQDEAQLTLNSYIHTR